MTDNGLMIRGYVKYYPDEEDSDAVACRFVKSFSDEKGKPMYTIVVIKQCAYMESSAKMINGQIMRQDKLQGPLYEYEVLFHDRQNRTKLVNLSFSPDWSLDEVESRVEALYNTGLFGGY